MITHYFKIAFRNMWKYKSQTLISVLGLAVGFTCFALATLWIRYEMSFDDFHKNAEQMYVVYAPSANSQTGYDRRNVNPMAGYLKEKLPEIANATSILPASRNGTIILKGHEVPALTISVDSSFFRMFDVKILEGSRDFLIPESMQLAITQEKYRQLFGAEHPIGKKVTIGNDEFTICAIVSGMPKRSNYPFDFLQPFRGYVMDQSFAWHLFSGENAIIELYPGTNIEAFEKKLYEFESQDETKRLSKLKIKPLTKLRYTDPDIDREVRFQHIVIFAVSGILVVLCSLFNYLALFVSRFRIRQKELALRVACGASGGSLLMMLSVEFIFTLLFSVLFGCIFTLLLHKPFLTLSNISMDLPAIYREMLIYIGGIILISFLAFWFILFIFRRRTLNISIRRSNKKLFRKFSVVVQLLISIGFTFCSVIILKQMYFLQHTDELGFSFKNRGSVTLWETPGDEGVLVDYLKQFPEITEIVYAKGLTNLLPQSGRWSRDISDWDDQPADMQKISLEMMYVSPEYAAFYDFRLVAGDMLSDADPENTVLISENVAKAFGWHDPIGKHFDGKYTVKGVIKHVYNFSPTMPVKPIFYLKHPPQMESSARMRDGTVTYGRLVLFKYHEGVWNSCKGKIEQMKNEFDIDGIYNAEEAYDEYLKSEKDLIKLLSFVSAICVLICVFGFVSLVSLTCEEQHKSIAIRKINGATSGDILVMFAREYFLLLCIGAAIAFSTGYYIMQHWLEQYVKQTGIPAWIYLSIVCVMALVIILCVGWQVYKASVKNPAEVVKSE